jgi:putative salt-induced outer membrane protein
VQATSSVYARAKKNGRNVNTVEIQNLRALTTIECMAMTPPRGRARIRVLAFLTLLSPAPAFAQAPADPPPPPRREGTAEFAFVGTTGNASTQTIGLGGDVIYRPPQWTLRNRAAFVRSKADSELRAKSLLYVSRAERALTTRLGAFGEYGYFRDRFAGVGHRNALMGGLSYKLVNLVAHQLSVDGGFGYLNERRLVGDNVSSATYGAGATYRWKLSDTAQVSDDARFTGTFADGDDWRLVQAAAVTARLTTLFSLKVANAIGYVHRPVPGFKSTDTSTSIALVAKF